MNTSSIVTALALVVAALVTPYGALGQHDFQYTKIVDPSGNADFTSIQAAIDDCFTPGADERYTVLIYAGVYDEALTLGNADPRIDLVGADRDAVIIKPAASTDAITIQGDGARNNTIRNLTIIEQDDPNDPNDQDCGVIIKEQTTGGKPSAIKIIDVTIKVEGEKSRGIELEDVAEDIEIRGFKITTAKDGARGIRMAAGTSGNPTKHVRITDGAIPCEGANSSGIAIQGQAEDVKIVDVTIKCSAENSNGVYIEERAEDIEIRGVRITTSEPASHAVVVSGGTTQNPSKNIRILDSRIATNGGMYSQGAASDGLHVDDPAEDIEIRNTFIYLEGRGGALNLDANVSDIDLEKVTVRSTAQAAGMYAPSSTRLRMTNCDVLQHDGNGIIVGTDTRISNSSIIVDSSFGGNGAPSIDDNAGIFADGKSGLRVSNSKLRGRREGMRLVGNCTDAAVTNCELIGSHYGAFLECGGEILFQGCLIVGDSAVGMYPAIPVPDYHGVFIDDKDDPNGCEPGEIRFVSCDIRGVSGKTDKSALGVRAKAAPADGPVEFIDCAITSRATAAGSPGPNDAKSFGVVADEAGAVALVGGSVGSSDADEREPDQFNLLNNAPTGLGIGVSGRKLSKWKGPIFAAGRKQSVVQRMLNVAQADPAKVADSADLDGVPIEPGLAGVLATYRALKVTWNNASGDDITITVSGINWAGDDIAEEFELSVGSPAKEGSKPFKTVETIYIPDAPGTISVGTTNKLGLYYPISADSDVLQEARLVSGVYTEQDTGTVDAVYSTVIPSAINAGDSFEWAVLASQ